MKKKPRMKISKSFKRKVEKDKIVGAYPQVSMLSSIIIKENEQRINIGGFSADGGFYLVSPYELIKGDENSGISGDLTYYNFIKSSKKMCKQEKALRKLEADKLKWEKEEEKRLEKELENLKKKKGGKKI